LLVTLIWPSRNALLLFGSSHDSVPGMNVGYSSFAYSSALWVSALSMTTLLSLSTILPPKAHISQCVQPESPVALPSAIPPGVPFACNALNIARKPAVSRGNLSTPAAFSMLSRYTIIAPAEPSGTPIHFLPSGFRYAWHESYQPPYFLPRYSHRSVTSSSFSGYRFASSLVDRMM